MLFCNRHRIRKYKVAGSWVAPDILDRINIRLMSGAEQG
jgi:hypothetical protein